MTLFRKNKYLYVEKKALLKPQWICLCKASSTLEQSGEQWLVICSFQTGSRCEQPAATGVHYHSHSHLDQDLSPLPLQFKLDCFWFFFKLSFPFSFLKRLISFFPSVEKRLLLGVRKHTERKNLQEAEGRLGKSVLLYTIFKVIFK